ncbi:Lrp/AsnC family transcriptional regulator [Phenylobacterium sp. SCN 70-31]|uniref:Lrp/AsnC family transcriptional regulator n=1 Tax=Phenylobacterium sp. SCN 70-31 TaxID=1660129 RepID=UPI000869A0CB|nr:Lrp/AsnC family transcriptional regulator [Phenylobacterium sp. SCN 70-31]ODT87476.1 MAG: hypothetical protein ABS78_11420 [Phenylobacterium sp. SCN 70-31]
MSEAPLLDEIDEELIRLLMADSRQSNRAIAQDLGLSEVTLRKRLKRLEDTGAIKYGLVVDVRATEMNVSGYLDVEARAADVQAVAEFIADLNLCAMCCARTGASNIRAFIYATDTRMMAATIETISRLPGVLRTEFRQAAGHAQHRYELIMPEAKPHDRWGN